MYNLTVLPGDGIGPEVVAQALRVLEAVAVLYPSCDFTTREALIGGIAIDETGDALPEETVELCRSSDAVLLGAVGGPKWDSTDPNAKRPEQGLLGIRKGLNLFANLRPVKVFDALVATSTLKEEIVKGVDMLVVRELTGGIYFGEHGRVGDRAYDTCEYREYEIERLMRVAFELAKKRGNLVHSIDKANVLESSRLWREVAGKVALEYPDVKLENQLVDNCAMQLVRNPRQFDVVATENMFGDILSDEASMIAGSLGMLASASLTGEGPGLYEPSHGSAPDIAGLDIANPIATIMSVAMMLRFSLDQQDAAACIEAAVDDVLERGFRTKDIYADSAGEKLVNCSEMGRLVAEALDA